MTGTVSERGINGPVGQPGGQTADRPDVEPAAGTLLEQIAERIGVQARVATIYGEPIDRDGVTVIPVAKAMWGFGGGTGQDKEQQGGSGGGGGASVSPVGFIEIRNGVAHYRPIFKPPVGIIAAVAGLTLGLLIGRKLGRRDAGHGLSLRGTAGRASGWVPSGWGRGSAPGWRWSRSSSA